MPTTWAYLGTGKTYEGVALDMLRSAECDLGPTLVVAPLTVLDNWRQHFEELSNYQVRVINPKKREEFLAPGADVYICHWEALRLLECYKYSWGHIIADEAHKMKNRKAQQTRALKQIRDVAFKTALTGTPVVNRPDEMWSILNWLYPKVFTSYWAFFRKYVEYDIDQYGYRKIKGPRNVQELHRRIGKFYIRRLKSDPEVELDLPEKYYTTVSIDLGAKQRRAYDMMKKEMIAWVGEHEQQALVAPVVIAQLIRLQQFALAYAEYNDEGAIRLAEPSAKLDAVMEIIGDTNESVVVFSQFKQAVYLLAARLEKAGISHVQLTGDQSKVARDAAVTDFQAGKARVLLGTISAGGVGITLTKARTVIFLDRSWSPALNLQAEDRLHRYGQKNNVQVIDLIARDTVDLGRHQRLEQKWEWIRKMLGR